MARWGISGAPIPAFVPFADDMEAACASYPDGFPPLFLAAIKWNETGASTDPGQLQDGANPATGLLPDGTNAGRGPFQLTSSWPPDWRDPEASAKYAINEFLGPAVDYWNGQVGLTGEALIKCVAASYNAGLTAAIAAHARGDVDTATTDGYGSRAVANYVALLNGRTPP